MIRSDSNTEKNKGVSIFVFLSVLILGTVVGSGVIYHYLTNIRSRELFIEESKNGIEMLASSAQAHLAPLIVFGGYDEVNDIMVNTFSRNANIFDAFIVLKDTNRIYYDLSGLREGSLFKDEMKDRNLKYYSLDIVPPGGMGIVTPKEVPKATLIIGYSVSDPITSQRMNTILDYSYSVFNEISSLLDTGQLGQARVVLTNMMLSNDNITNVRLINNQGIVFFNLYKSAKGKFKPGQEGVKTNKKILRMSKKVSIKKPILLNRTINKNGEPIVEIYMPMLRKNRIEGTMYLEYSISSLVSDQKKSFKMLITAISLSVIAGFAGALATSYLISKPIRKLALAVRKAGAGEFEQKIHVGYTGQEIHSLAQDFNKMLHTRKEAEQSLKESEQQLRYLASMLITSQEEERNRIGRELHDEFGHKFLTLSLLIETIKKKGMLPQEEVEKLINLVRDTSRELMRIYSGLKPTLIERIGLSAAVESLVHELKSHPEIEVNFEIDPISKDALPHAAALSIFRIAQESITNILKHARAKHVIIRLKNEKDNVILRVEDDGAGFQYGSFSPARANIGLISMKERALAIGGRITIESNHGKGTRIFLSVPH